MSEEPKFYYRITKPGKTIKDMKIVSIADMETLVGFLFRELGWTFEIVQLQVEGMPKRE